MAEEAEAPVIDPRLQLDHRRVEAPGVGDAEHYPGTRHRIERRFGALHIERKGLFHKDVLAGGRRPLDLRPVLAVRRREDDGVDRRVGEDRIEIVLERNAVLGAEGLRRGAGAGVAGSEADLSSSCLGRN